MGFEMGGLMVKHITKLCRGEASFYIVTALIIIAWVLIGLKIRVFASGEEAVNTYTDAHSHADSGLLWLVNKDNRLAADYTPGNLISHEGIFLRAPAHEAYKQMLTAMRNDEIWGLQLASAYRPYAYQHDLFMSRLDELKSEGYSPNDAISKANQTLQPPGASEHQTGLALDVTVAGDLTSDFGKTTAGIWIAENAHRFGFIIRYPYSKIEITQIAYEPWHLRYVGVPHAEIIRENNLTLEEYAGFISDAGAYIVWDSPRGSRAYYLVVFSDIWLENIPGELVDISSISPGEGAGYIITLRGVYRVY